MDFYVCRCKSFSILFTQKSNSWAVSLGRHSHFSKLANSFPGGLLSFGNGNPLQYSCLGKSQGQRSLAGYSPQGCKELDTTEHACSAKRRKSASYGGGPERGVLVCFSTTSNTWDHETSRSLCGSVGCNMVLSPFPNHSLRTQQEGLPEPQDELVVPSLATHSRPLVA